MQDIRIVSEKITRAHGEAHGARSAEPTLPSRGFIEPARVTAQLGIDPGMSVADFGAGSGAYVIPLAHAVGPSGRVFAIDVQKDLLRRAKNNAEAAGCKNVDVIWADMEVPGGTKIADRLLDLVLMSNVLFQLKDKKRALAEAKRILKSNGKLVLIEWSESFGGTGPQKADVVSKDNAMTLALATGFQFVRLFPAGTHHYGLIFKV